MRRITSRINLLYDGVTERLRYGSPKSAGPRDREVLFVLDGVGGFQLGPLLVRRVLRERDEPIGTVAYRWQTCVTGGIWTDLMWHRRNRVVAAQFARLLANFRRRHPSTTIHLLAFSGGCGIATFALERLADRGWIDTLVLAAPALSREYNLGPALRAVRRCYVLVSHRDRWILGLGTRIFGTTDRRFAASAGKLGFQVPAGLSGSDLDAYDRCREIRWSAEMQWSGHFGGHIGWVCTPFLRAHLCDLLRGIPSVETFPVCVE